MEKTWGEKQRSKHEDGACAFGQMMSQQFDRQADEGTIQIIVW